MTHPPNLETPALVMDSTRSPHAMMRGVPLDAVRFGPDGFWHERLQQTTDVTVRRLWELLAAPEAGHVLDNFRIAAGLERGEFTGTHWQDAWLYKWIEAAACLFRLTRESWLDKRMDEGIQLIAAAQEPDGYVATQIRARGWPRFQKLNHHEVYTMGHLLTAAVVHRRMTGKTAFLDIAVRVGDFLCRTLGRSVPCCFAHNPSAVMGLVELFRETGRKDYLDCAQLIVDERGAHPNPQNRWERPPGFAGTDQIQDRVPLRSETEVVGHNVFFTYLYAGAADVFIETGDTELLAALRRLWDDLVRRKINLNGGVSPMGAGLSIRHDPVGEAVGAAYFLPNADAYNETCGQIGNLLWNTRMLCAEGKARYADMIEHELFNGILSGIGLDGESWWYRNPLRRHEPGEAGPGLNDLPCREKPGRRRICCPTNVLRTLAEVGSWFYTLSEDTCWVQLYGAGRAELHVPGPQANDAAPLVLAQRTDYPWDGEVTIEVVTAPERALTIRLRVPSWASSGGEVRLTLNGKDAGVRTVPGSYAALHRRWSPGDTLVLSLPFEPRLVQAHPRAEHLCNQVAVMRGPVLYCLESVDLDAELNWTNVLLPTDVQFKLVTAAALSSRLPALECTALYRDEPDWGEELYRTVPAAELRPIRVRLVPYFAWANRGLSAMSVWLPAAWRSDSAGRAGDPAEQETPGPAR